MSEVVLAGLLAGWAVAVPVGAIGAYLVSLSASAPWRTGVAAALGVATADGAYALLAVVTGSALAPLVTRAAGPLRWGAAAVLLALSARVAVAALRPVTAVRVPAPQQAFARLLGLTLANPMTLVVFAALAVGLRGGWSTAEQLVFALSAFTASASWQLLLTGAGVALGRALTGPRGRLVTALASSVVMAALAVDLVMG